MSAPAAKENRSRSCCCPTSYRVYDSSRYLWFGTDPVRLRTNRKPRRRYHRTGSNRDVPALGIESLMLGIVHLLSVEHTDRSQWEYPHAFPVVRQHTTASRLPHRFQHFTPLPNPHKYRHLFDSRRQLHPSTRDNLWTALEGARSVKRSLRRCRSIPSGAFDTLH